MSKRVEITTCSECPYSFHRKGEKKPYCGALSKSIEVDTFVTTDSRCPLEEVDRSAISKDDHRLAIRHLYQILQKKGMNEDSLHDANCYFNQYLKDLGK